MPASRSYVSSPDARKGQLPFKVPSTAAGNLPPPHSSTRTSECVDTVSGADLQQAADAVPRLLHLRRRHRDVWVLDRRWARANL
eukprot:5751577-Pleurochrysis_carterae.AAC.2